MRGIRGSRRVMNQEETNAIQEIVSQIFEDSNLDYWMPAVRVHNKFPGNIPDSAVAYWNQSSNSINFQVEDIDSADLGQHMIHVIYHEVAHLVNFQEQTGKGHAEGFQGALESLIKDGLEAGSLTVSDIQVMEKSEHTYATKVGYDGDASEEFVAMMVETIEAVDTGSVEYFKMVQDVLELPESIAFDSEVKDIRVEALNHIEMDNVIDIMEHIVALEDNSDTFLDLNNDGVVNISDAILGLRLIVGLEEAYSAATFGDDFIPMMDFA